MRAVAKLSAIPIVFVLMLSQATGTAQEGDVLVVDSVEYRIHTTPLEPFFEAHPDLRPQSEGTASFLWRGYVAHWEISENRLFLTDVQVPDQGPQYRGGFGYRSAMATVFPEQHRVLADWFTGHMIAPSGKLLEYVHMGFASTYEKYTVFTVVKGLVKAERSMTAGEFRRFREAQFRLWQETAEYAKAFQKLKGEFDTPAEAESFLFEGAGARYMSIVWGESPRQ